MPNLNFRVGGVDKAIPLYTGSIDSYIPVSPSLHVISGGVEYVTPLISTTWSDYGKRFGSSNTLHVMYNNVEYVPGYWQYVTSFIGYKDITKQSFGTKPGNYSTYTYGKSVKYDIRPDSNGFYFHSGAGVGTNRDGQINFYISSGPGSYNNTNTGGHCYISKDAAGTAGWIYHTKYDTKGGTNFGSDATYTCTYNGFAYTVTVPIAANECTTAEN
jgi:hypothetical protein